jgi:SAM-dependent methyltransferase
LGRIWRFEHRRINQRTLAILGIEPGQSVLELGCGSGAALAGAIDQADGGNVLGLDVSETMVAMATRRNRRAIDKGVTDRAEGTRRLYAVDTRGVQALRTWLEGFWDEALAAFKNAAEQEAAKERKSS